MNDVRCIYLHHQEAPDTPMPDLLGNIRSLVAINPLLTSSLYEKGKLYLK